MTVFKRNEWKLINLKEIESCQLKTITILFFIRFLPMISFLRFAISISSPPNVPNPHPCIFEYQLKCVTQSEDIWKFEDVSDVPKDPRDQENEKIEVRDYDVLEHKSNSLQIEFTSQRDQINALKLEDEIHQVLEELRKSQEYEYKVAEEMLNAQKNYILNLYQQLVKERSELANGTASAVPDISLDTIMKRMDQIKKEVQKLRDMEEVAPVFRRTSKSTLREHFGFEGDS